MPPKKRSTRVSKAMAKKNKVENDSDDELYEVEETVPVTKTYKTEPSLAEIMGQIKELSNEQKAFTKAYLDRIARMNELKAKKESSRASALEDKRKKAELKILSKTDEERKRLQKEKEDKEYLASLILQREKDLIGKYNGQLARARVSNLQF